jgi:hypothetical protein
MVDWLGDDCADVSAAGVCTVFGMVKEMRWMRLREWSVGCDVVQMCHY